MQLKMEHHGSHRGYVSWHILEVDGKKVCFPEDEVIQNIFIEVFLGKKERQPMIHRFPENMYLIIWMPPGLDPKDRETFLAKVAEKSTYM